MSTNASTVATHSTAHTPNGCIAAPNVRTPQSVNDGKNEMPRICPSCKRPLAADAHPLVVYCTTRCRKRGERRRAAFRDRTASGSTQEAPTKLDYDPLDHIDLTSTPFEACDDSHDAVLSKLGYIDKD